MSIFSRATEAGREYVTPEDVQDCIDAGEDVYETRRDVLGLIGGAFMGEPSFGIEDSKLCAFLAYDYTPTTEEERAEAARFDAECEEEL
jgi:hypothetical protein